MKKKLAIITTHPIQYNIPLFRLLASRDRIEIMVFYTWGESVLESKYDPGFGKVIQWDIPLLEGYPSRFLRNESKLPGSDHFDGIVNPDIISELDSWGPDAILIYGWKFNSHLKVMRHYRGKVPVWFRGDSTMLDDHNFLRLAARRAFLKWVYKHVDKVFYVGANNKTYFKRHGIREAQLILAPHAVDNGFFAEKDGEYLERARKWRQELGIGEDAFVFLFAGKLEAKKSPQLLMDAFKKGQFSRPAWLVFVGNGHLEYRLKMQAQHPHVRFIDFRNQSEMPVVYRLADVYVLPSQGPGETWGLAINEAMASGKPVIASTKCGGAIDLVINGEDGYIFKGGDLADLTGKMELMVSATGERLQEMGRNALVYIQLFSVERVANIIEETLVGNID